MRWRPRGVLFIALCLLAAAAMGWNYSRLRPWHPGILGDVPASAKLVRHERLNHGLLDSCDVFEFACADSALREHLIDRWKLKELGDDEESKLVLSMMTSDSPEWWPKDLTALGPGYARKDDKVERYWGVWEDRGSGRLFVARGNW